MFRFLVSRAAALTGLTGFRGARCLPSPSELRLVLCLLACVFAIGSRADASGGGTPPPRYALEGHVPHLASTSAVLGRADAAELVGLALALPLRNQQGLTDLLRRQYDPADPQYRRFLTPAEFTARFAPAQADYDAVIAFARANGLTVRKAHANRILLDVSGPAATVEKAFGTRLMVYRSPEGRTFRAPEIEPSLPAALAGKVAAVIGLNTASLRTPHLVCLGPADALAPLAIGSGPGGAMSPSDIRAAYGLSSLTQTGAGQTLALFEADDYHPSDIAAYESNFGITPVPLQNVKVDGGSSPTAGGIQEVTLDIELQIALAPGATKILVYEGPNSDLGAVDTYNQIAVDDQAGEISTSWGQPESAVGWAFVSAEATIFSEMAAQGQAIFSAAGDNGADDGTSSLSADDPSAQPYVTAVGGTTLTTSGAGGAWSAETVWNNVYGATGGGVSAFWARPSYQTGVVSSASLGSTIARNVPDVALDADPSTGYAIYVQGGWWLYGGTSCAAPLWSAYAALVNQQCAALGQPPIGFFNPTLYAIGASSGYATAFHDIADHTTNGYYPAVTGYDCATGWGTPNSALFASLIAVHTTPPTLTTVSPGTVTVGSAATTITLTGTGFIAGAAATWSGSALATTYYSPTKLTAAVPATDLSTAGSFNVTVVNPGAAGLTSAALSFGVTNVTPTLTSVSPNSAAGGSAATTVTLTGTGFVSGATAQWNGSALPTTYVSSTQLTATVPASDLTAGGAFNITVLNPGPGNPTSSALTFTVTNATPALTSVSPNVASLGSAAQPATLTGTGFTATAKAYWNGVAIPTTYVSATQLTATIAASKQATAGVFAITVADPASGNVPSNALSFTVNNPAPSLGGIMPRSAPAGSTAVTLTVAGSLFVTGSQVQFNGTALTTTYLHSDQLTALIPAGSLTTQGTFPVTVFTPSPGGGASAAITFTVTNPIPVLTSVSPNSATAGSAATTLTLTGTGFLSGAKAQWNGAALTTTYVSTTQLTATLPASDLTATGSYSITVLNPGSGSPTSGALTFTVKSPPTLASVSPNTASLGTAAQSATLTGTGFTATAKAYWNAVAIPTTYVSPTQLTATIAASKQATAGVFAITVADPASGSVPSNAVSFTVNNPAPSLAGILPRSAPAGSAAVTLTVSGSLFVPSSQVRFNGTTLTTTYLHSDQLTAVIPASSLTTAGSFPVIVFTSGPGGGASSALTFTVTNATPTLTSVSPNTAGLGSAAQSATLIGTGFTATAKAYWNGVAIPTTYVSPTQLTATIAASKQAAAGVFAITVADPASGSVPSNALSFTVTNPAPTLAGIMPRSAPAGSAAVTLTVAGSLFVTGSQVQFNGTPLATTYLHSDQLTAVIPASSLTTAGSFTVTVFTPGPGGGTSAALTFTVTGAAPTLTSVSPNTASVGTAAQSATLTGTGFTATAKAYWNGVAIPTTYVSPTQLTATIAASKQATAGVFAVTVADPASGSVPSNAVSYTVTNPAPSLTGIVPRSAPAGSADLTVTVYGPLFVTSSQVLLNGTPLATTYLHSDQLTAVIPAADLTTTGTFSITVFTPGPGGGTSGALTFTVE